MDDDIISNEGNELSVLHPLPSSLRHSSDSLLETLDEGIQAAKEKSQNQSRLESDITRHKPNVGNTDSACPKVSDAEFNINTICDVICNSSCDKAKHLDGTKMNTGEPTDNQPK